MIDDWFTRWFEQNTTDEQRDLVEYSLAEEMANVLRRLGHAVAWPPDQPIEKL